MSTTTSRPQRKDAADNRTALLDAARVLLNRDPSVSLEVIAAEAGLSRRSVYGHFSNRDELMLELVTSGSKRVATALEGISHPDPVIRLALIASRLWREVESVRMMAVVAVRGPLASHTATALEPIRSAVREAIRDGQAVGAMRTDLPRDLLARLVEDTALIVLEESAEHPLASADGHILAMLMTLGVVGYGWRDAQAIIDGHPELHGKGSE